LGSGTLPEKSGSRTRRFVLATIAILSLALIATQIFLHQTSVGSRKFVGNTFLLWTATVLVILALLILATVLVRNLVRLYFDRKSGQVGSRFRVTMVTTFVVLSLLPAVLLFFLAYGLINFSIDRWFGAPAAQMVENSRDIAAQYYGELQRDASHFAERIAASVSIEDSLNPESRSSLNEKLERLRQEYRLEGARVFDSEGAEAAQAGERVSTKSHQAQIATVISATLRGKPDFQVKRITPQDALREVVWATAPIRSAQGKIVGAVLTESLIPSSVNFKAYSVMEAYGKYVELQREKTALQFQFILMLALSTLLIVFAFSWFGMYLAKRITGPIKALAEGSAAVASGNLNHRVECEAFDELGDLVASFNRMTGELQEHKAHIEIAQNTLQEANVELDDRRRYIETILQTISTGVISLDGNYRIHTMNRAAAQMLEVQGPVADVRLEQVVKEPAAGTLFMLLHKSAVLGVVVRTIEIELPGRTLHVATTVTPLLDSSGQRTGWVLVLDDVTELLRVEKMAAWQEVARRLAHEIKNPLTPIQLSASRVLRRYRQIMSTSAGDNGSWHNEFVSFENLLEECVQVIRQEANSLKDLVDEFSRFARLPQVKLEDADVHRILESTLSLYNGRFHDVRLTKEFGPDVPSLKLDPEQMKRVFINLFDNALEAMADNSHAKLLRIRTYRSVLKASIRIEVSDTGRGFPPEYRDSLFLPYFSTRKDGTGLGLAIVRQIISDHHGQISAEVNSPLGTKIVIDLPLAPS
jgi:two-component system nitrogen regulation sensor histidine kinase NtrY